MSKWEIIDELEGKLAELDAEMEALGIEDATAWERFDEYEDALYLLAEYRLGWHDPVEVEAAEWDGLIEFVEVAEENALAELAAYGYISPGYVRKLSEFDPDEIMCLYDYGVEYDGFGGCDGNGIEFDEYAPYSLMA